MMPIEIAALIQLIVMAYAVRVMCRTDRRQPPVDQRRVVVHLATITLAVFLSATILEVMVAVPPQATEQIWHFGAATAAIGTGAAVYYSTGRRW
jgi:hypothetical protein